MFKNPFQKGLQEKKQVKGLFFWKFTEGEKILQE